MNNYKDFGLKDFLDDSRFQDWVYRGHDDQFWQNIIKENPSQLESIEQAKSILLSVRGELDVISEQEVKLRVSILMSSLDETKKVGRLLWLRQRWLRIAAVLLITSGFVAYFNRGKFMPLPQPYYVMLKDKETNMTEVKNDSEKIKLVNLPDGSSVVLKKNARISYPTAFAAEKREVYLLGEAFFEVEKNPAQPFYVYSEELITKVSGTSFSIQANDGSNDIKLVVKSGRVEVSTWTSDANSTGKTQNKAAILNPNQLVTINRRSLNMVTKKVDSPVLINLPVETIDFSFKRMPLKEVFSLLEAAYGIRINFDKTITDRCSITAKLGDEPVYEKLNMICAVVNASFSVSDQVVEVQSDGCGDN